MSSSSICWRSKRSCSSSFAASITARDKADTTRTVSPLTLAVLDGMIVTVGKQTYVIPLSHIVESLRPNEHNVSELGDGAAMLDVLSSDYILAARARGVAGAGLFWRHQLRNVLLPVVTELGPAVAAITTGGFVVELVFAIPGLGRYFVQAVQQLDYTVIMGTTVFYGAFLVLVVVLVDISYGLIDPRIRLVGGRG